MQSIKSLKAAAADLLNVNQPKISALLHYKLDGYSVERLMIFLTALDRDVEISIKKPSKKESGRIWNSFRLYWALYGGWRALLTSPYFHFSIAITIMLSRFWIGDDGAKIWPQASTNILPNMMGFSVAGMAVFLAFSQPQTMKAITEEGEPKSYFMLAVAQFFHFIFVQAVAMLLGVVGLHFASDYLSAFGVFFLIYSLFVGVAMAMTLLHTAQIINAASSLPDQTDEKRRR